VLGRAEKKNEINPARDLLAFCLWNAETARQSMRADSILGTSEILYTEKKKHQGNMLAGERKRNTRKHIITTVDDWRAQILGR
jgi:hypothetical protein